MGEDFYTCGCCDEPISEHERLECELPFCDNFECCCKDCFSILKIKNKKYKVCKADVERIDLVFSEFLIKLLKKENRDFYDTARETFKKYKDSENKKEKKKQYNTPYNVQLRIHCKNHCNL
jgi:hypothetical protein